MNASMVFVFVVSCFALLAVVWLWGRSSGKYAGYDEGFEGAISHAGSVSSLNPGKYEVLFLFEDEYEGCYMLVRSHFLSAPRLISFGRFHSQKIPDGEFGIEVLNGIWSFYPIEDRLSSPREF